MTAAESQWYVFQNNEQLGPFSLKDLTQKITQKQIDQEAFAYTDGFKDWIPIKNVPELTPHFPSQQKTVVAPLRGKREDTMWSLNKDGKTVGSFDLTELKRKLSEGEISGRDYVWTDGWQDWIPIEKAQEFKTTVHEVGGATSQVSAPPSTSQGILQRKQHITSEITQPTISSEDLPPQETETPKGNSNSSYSSPYQPSYNQYQDIYGKPKSSMKKLILLLIIVGLAGYAYMNRENLPVDLSFIKKYIPAMKGSHKLASTPTQGAMNSVTDSRPTLGSETSKILGGQGLSDSLYSDFGVVAIRTTGAGIFYFVSHSVQDPYFAVSTFSTVGSSAISPVLPHKGPTRAYVFKKEPTGFTLVTQKTFSSDSKEVGALTALPERTEKLNQAFKLVSNSIEKIQSHRKRAPLWKNFHFNLWKAHTSLKPSVETCLPTLHLPQQCAELAQLWKDGLDLHMAAVFLFARSPISKIKVLVGRSEKEILDSIKQNQKSLAQFIESPAAVSQVAPEDLKKWLEIANSNP